MFEQETHQNNKVELLGTISGDFTFSHSVYGERFYSFFVSVDRLSQCTDSILVTASEHILDENIFTQGNYVCIAGQYRSYNNYTGVGNKLILTVFVKHMAHYCTDCEDKNPNSIYLSGFICKPPTFRTTPFGREITDLLLAVNRTHNKSDYIPCICWGRNARFASTLCVGDHIDLHGRIQSREYQKKINENDYVTKTAYEVSVSKIELL